MTMSDKAQVLDLIKVLLRWHRRYLTLERIDAEQHLDKKISPYEFLHMLTQDSYFDWLRPLSSMIADIDAFSEDIEITSQNKSYASKEIKKVLALPKIQQRSEEHKVNDSEFRILHDDLIKKLQTFES